METAMDYTATERIMILLEYILGFTIPLLGLTVLFERYPRLSRFFEARLGWGNAGSNGKIGIKKTTYYDSFPPVPDPVDLAIRVVQRLAYVYGLEDLNNSIPLKRVLLNAAEWRTYWYFPREFNDGLIAASFVLYDRVAGLMTAPEDVDIGIQEGRIFWGIRMDVSEYEA